MHIHTVPIAACLLLTPPVIYGVIKILMTNIKNRLRQRKRRIASCVSWQNVKMTTPLSFSISFNIFFSYWSYWFFRYLFQFGIVATCIIILIGFYLIVTKFRQNHKKKGGKLLYSPNKCALGMHRIPILKLWNIHINISSVILFLLCNYYYYISVSEKIGFFWSPYKRAFCKYSKDWYLASQIR